MTKLPHLRSVLMTGVASLGIAGAHPAAAQNSPSASPQPASSSETGTPNPQAQTNAQSDQGGGDVVVTGTLFRRTNTETPSPVTVLTAENLQRQGITNVADAIRSISADNSGSVPTAFTSGFGSGAAAVSLRGLTVNSTLVLIDGVRTVNYPYADDGQRAFVDLNSIPKSTIDRIEVLKDGASSLYGADAIGGVVNIITRKQVQGIEGTVEGGVSDHGDGGEQRFTLSAGYGDLSKQRFNVYVNGEYEHDNYIGATERGFPYNTADLSGIGGINNNPGSPALQAFGIRQGATSAVVAPANQTVPGNIFSGQALTDANGNPLPTRILNPRGCAQGLIAHSDASGSYCEDNQVRFTTIAPGQKRYGFTGHVTVKVGDDSEAYLAGTYYRSEVYSTAAPQTIRQTNPISTTRIVLPARLANGQLNPYDPYAAQGLAAQISYAFGDLPDTTRTNDDLYRIAGGISGKFGAGWSYSFDASYARSNLENISTGYLNIAGLTSAIVNGTYNFIDPTQNSAAIRNQVSPTVLTRANAEVYLAQGTVSKELFQLPGGSLQLAVGGQVRHESLNNPNANANQAFLNLNAVTAAGSRTITAGFFEVNAPIFKQLEVNGSGRYDHYSEGFDNFSPKIGAKFTPFRQLAIRGTYSQGFRAPSFAESQNGSVIGFTNSAPQAVLIAAHSGDAYTQTYSIGFNSASNPNLKPEKSRSFTAGAVFQPARWLSFTADYYNIKKTDVISGGPLAGQALSNYYAGQQLPAGYTVTLDDPDPQAPNAIRRVLIVNSLYQNAAALLTSGIDVSAEANIRVTDTTKIISRLEGTEIFNYNFKPSADRPYDHYVGTQAPYITSSGAGTPRWRANWSNTLLTGPFSLTATAYYTSGYKAIAEDQVGHGARTCDDQLYNPGVAFCHIHDFFQLDMVGEIKVSEKFTFYVNVINALNAHAPIDPANYAATNYNPTYTQQGVVGRFLRAGANFKF